MPFRKFAGLVLPSTRCHCYSCAIISGVIKKRPIFCEDTEVQTIFQISQFLCLYLEHVSRPLDHKINSDCLFRKCFWLFCAAVWELFVYQQPAEFLSWREFGQ